MNNCEGLEVKLHKVKIEQNKNDILYPKISIDGIFGSGTKEAVMKYQKSRGLTVDGLAGKGTHKAIIND